MFWTIVAFIAIAVIAFIAGSLAFLIMVMSMDPSLEEGAEFDRETRSTHRR